MDEIHTQAVPISTKGGEGGLGRAPCLRAISYDPTQQAVATENCDSVKVGPLSWTPIDLLRRRYGSLVPAFTAVSHSTRPRTRETHTIDPDQVASLELTIEVLHHMHATSKVFSRVVWHPKMAESSSVCTRECCMFPLKEP